MKRMIIIYNNEYNTEYTMDGIYSIKGTEKYLLCLVNNYFQVNKRLLKKWIINYIGVQEIDGVKKIKAISIIYNMVVQCRGMT